MLINIDRAVRITGSVSARIVYVSDEGDFPILVVIDEQGDGVSSSDWYSLSGKSVLNSNDLTNEPMTRNFWYRVYDTGTGFFNNEKLPTFYLTKIQAHCSHVKGDGNFTVHNVTLITEW